VLICGDLALQHDSNGWLLASEASPTSAGAADR